MLGNMLEPDSKIWWFCKDLLKLKKIWWLEGPENTIFSHFGNNLATKKTLARK
jgi:hypothetical protein